jgi:hypothetical protein
MLNLNLFILVPHQLFLHVLVTNIVTCSKKHFKYEFIGYVEHVMVLNIVVTLARVRSRVLKCGRKCPTNHWQY